MSAQDEIEHAYQEAAGQPRPKPQITARLVEITPAMAEKLLKRNTHNRSIQDSRVSQYAADIANGDWQVNGEAIKISAGGQILDGQHRLQAILTADAPIHTLLITGLADSTQETMDQGRARSFADVLKLRNEPNHGALAAATRTAFMYDRDGVPYKAAFTTSPSVKQLSAFLARNPELRDSVAYAHTLGRRPWLSERDAAAMHFLMSAVDKAEADDFIHKVITGDGHRSVDPTYVLRERLIKEHYDGGLDIRTKLAFVIKAWNAYRTGEQIERLKWTPGGLSPEPFPHIHGMPERVR